MICGRNLGVVVFCFRDRIAKRRGRSMPLAGVLRE
jgi:hypothetical protein